MDELKTAATNETVQRLDNLIMLAQWDPKLPYYIAKLSTDPALYRKALEQIQAGSKNDPAPPQPADSPLTKEEWEKLFGKVTTNPALKDFFKTDPFPDATSAELSVLAEVSDVTTDLQTMVTSRNGTFLEVVEVVRKSPSLDTEDRIWEGLNRFLMLIDSDKSLAEMLYNLARSNDWFVVLASLRDGRDYAREEGPAATAALKDWNAKLTAATRSILFKHTHLSRTPRKLIELAWEERDLFEQARSSVKPYANMQNPAEVRERTTTATLVLLRAKAKPILDDIESDLRLLGTVATHFIEVRKFAKLDGFVYTWPDISRLAMRNYAGLRYVEDCLLDRREPEQAELDRTESRELYEMCKREALLIRFLRFHPHFREINEDDLGRYRSLAPGVDITQTNRPSFSQRPPEKSEVPPPAGKVDQIPELKIRIEGQEDKDPAKEANYIVDVEGTGLTTVRFSAKKLLDAALEAAGVKSDDSFQPILKELFAQPGSAEALLLRAGVQLQSSVLGTKEHPGMEAFLNKRQGGRIVLRLRGLELHFLPWEWLPGPGSQGLLLSQPRFSVVRASSSDTTDAAPAPLKTPLQLMSVMPNPPAGVRANMETSARALEGFSSNDKVRYRAMLREEASFANTVAALKSFAPQILHFEGYVSAQPPGPPVGESLFWVHFTSSRPEGEVIDILRFAREIKANGVQLVMIGRNQANTVYGNPAAGIATALLNGGVPAVLLPIRPIDDPSATAFAISLYTSLLQGSPLEEAIYSARRQLASRGGDWTAWALFANPSVLNFFQLLPGIA